MLKKALTSLLVIFCCILTIGLKAQNFSNFRMGSMIIDTTVIKLDSLSIIPQSFQLTGLNPDEYSIDYITATLTINNNDRKGNQIAYSYRLFSFDLGKKYYHKPVSMIISKTASYQPKIMPISTFTSREADDNLLISKGSISRGITVGNNQYLVLNSNLNLQLSGMLTEDIEIKANISDKNIPIQPEGNSRIIQDFDKIFIQLKYKNQFALNAGDIDIVKPEGYFLSVNKRILGMEFIAENKFKSNDILYNKVGGGVTKGKYVRYTLSVTEGVQGPYQLKGEQNEINIVILSGTERIYIDGKLLTRGQENDYSIDYNTGELTFSSRIFVTNEKIFIVEFEYKDLFYSHYTLYSFNEFQHEKNPKLKLNVNFFHEQDMKNFSIQPELDDSQKQFLSQLGDSISQCYYPNVDSVQYNKNEILYKSIDTIINGIHYSPVYIHSTNSEEQLYRLGFSYLGNNKGNYVLSQSTSNGRVFNWVAPKDGIPQGNYEPVILLSTPKLTQMGSIGAKLNFAENSGFNTEIAFSNYDKNTFSNIDDKDNVGVACKFNLFHKNKINSKKEINKEWFFLTNLSYEFVHKNFNPVENYREIDFFDHYNLQENYSSTHSEHILEYQAGFSNELMGTTHYKLNYLNRYQDVSAFRNEINSKTQIKGFTISTLTSYLTTKDSIQKTKYFCSYNNFSKQFRKIEIGIKDNLEQNLFINQSNDSLRSNSFSFNEAILFLKNNDTLPYLYSISFMNRIDNLLKGNSLSTNSIINEANISFELAQLKNNRIRGNIIYRNTKLKDSTSKFVSDNYLIGSLEYSGRFFKSAIIISTYYEAGRGIEQKQTFSYLKVANGEGTYVWIDYNNNGIEELDEFELAAFRDEANYIKIWISSTDLMTTYNNQFTQSIQLRPGNVWSKKTGFLKFLSRFSNSTTFHSFQKNSLKNNLAAYNPFNFNLQDSLLVSSNLNFINTLSFNQLSSIWGMDFIIQKTQNKNLLYYGFEKNILSLQKIILRINPTKNLLLKNEYTHSLKENNSEYLVTKNFKIDSHILQSSLNINYKTTYYITLTYLFKNKKNYIGTEKMFLHNIGVNFNYRIPKKGNLDVKFQYIKISINDNSSNSISYEMLEGLKKGNNGVWGISYQGNITEYLQFEIEYEGRASTGNKVINMGNIQLRAHF